MSSQMSAVELLKLGDQGRTVPWVNQYWKYILGSFFGVGTAVFINFGTRRPAFSGIQKHVIATVGYTGLLHFLGEKRETYYAERDAVFRHYVELHPEDFVTPERVKIGDALEKWIPVR